MTIFERHKRAFLLTGIFICLTAIVLTINPRFGSNFISRGFSLIVTPMQRGLNSSISWVRGHFSALVNNQNLITENRRLLEENIHLQLENERLQLAAKDNEALSTLFNMHGRYSALPTMGARVIGFDPNDWHNSFHIDIGSNDGIKIGMAVIGDGGLIGVVRYVHSNRSQVVAITDSRFAAAVMSYRTEDVGTVRGEVRLMQQGLIRLDHFDASAQFMPGDEIHTSSHSSIFPRGLFIGTIKSLHTNPDGLTRHAIIEPAANLTNIEVVLVVTEVFGDANETEIWASEE